MPELNRKSAYHHGDLKAALIEETARILRAEGAEALSLRRLAANLGVSRTAPYNHFKNKEALLSAVAEEGFARFEAAQIAARNQIRTRDGLEQTYIMVRAYIDFARNNPEYYDLMYGRTSWHAIDADSALAKTARGVLRSDIERLKKLQARGAINRDLDVPRFAQVYWGMLHGMSRLLLDGVYSDAASVKRLAESAADVLWEKMKPR